MAPRVLIVLGVALMVVAAAVLAAMLGNWSTTSVQIILVLPTVIGASLLGWGIGGGLSTGGVKVILAVIAVVGACSSAGASPGTPGAHDHLTGRIASEIG